MKTEELIKSTDAWEELAGRCATCLATIRLGLVPILTACNGLASPAALMLVYQALNVLVLVFMLPPKSLTTIPLTKARFNRK